MTETCSTAVKTPSLPHRSNREGVCISLWQTCYLKTRVQRNTHQGSVLCARREGSLHQDSKFLLKGKSGNNVETRDQTGPLPRRWSFSHSTPHPQEDWDTHDLCTATICKETAFSEAAVWARTLLPRCGLWCTSLLLSVCSSLNRNSQVRSEATLCRKMQSNLFKWFFLISEEILNQEKSLLRVSMLKKNNNLPQTFLFHVLKYRG